MAFKLLSTALAVPISRAITKATGKAWVKARPGNPPHNPKDVQTSWKDALIFSTLTGLSVAFAQLLTTKGADTIWRAITGTPSPRPKEAKAGTKAAQQQSTL